MRETDVPAGGRAANDMDRGMFVGRAAPPIAAPDARSSAVKLLPLWRSDGRAGFVPPERDRGKSGNAAFMIIVGAGEVDLERDLADLCSDVESLSVLPTWLSCSSACSRKSMLSTRRMLGRAFRFFRLKP